MTLNRLINLPVVKFQTLMSPTLVHLKSPKTNESSGKKAKTGEPV
jgi:hypothetical protein